MFVDFWAVGATTMSSVPMTVGHISSHLLADWLPSLPSSVSTSIIGWPPVLIEARYINGRNVLTLHERSGRTERQWKGVLSWMLGVAGTRQVLAAEGYRWIAPLSAFYSDAVHEVDLSNWHISFPRSSIVADRNPESRSRLRPDYLALRTAAAEVEWAVAESKGTKRSLVSMNSCPRSWANQARNVVITVNDSVIRIPRHLVVATRVNPNASQSFTRRLQLRAWNRRDDSHLPTSSLPPSAALDIVSAHLFGLFGGLQLRENARTIALSVQARSEARRGRVSEVTRRHVDVVAQRCDDELHRRGRAQTRTDGLRSEVFAVDTDRGAIEVDIIEPVFTLARKLQVAENDDAAATALKEADRQLDDWQQRRRTSQPVQEELWLPFGVEIRLPQGFESR